MINALEAKHLSEQENEEDSVFAKSTIDGKVRTAIKEGHRVAWIYGNYKQLAIAKRIAAEAGYTVDLSDSQKDGPTLKISW